MGLLMRGMTKRQAYRDSGQSQCNQCARACQGFADERDNSARCVWPLEGRVDPG